MLLDDNQLIDGRRIDQNAFTASRVGASARPDSELLGPKATEPQSRFLLEYRRSGGRSPPETEVFLSIDTQILTF